MVTSLALIEEVFKPYKYESFSSLIKAMLKVVVVVVVVVVVNYFMAKQVH